MPSLTVPDIFTRHTETKTAYTDLASYVRALGTHKIEIKKTCMHFVAGKAAFLGVHPRKNGLRITVVLGRSIESSRIASV